MTAELHTMTGAYALDAVSAADRAEFERHLGECAACRQEVAELRATGARLGVAAAVDPPPSLKLVVLADVARTRQLPPRVPVVRRLSRAKTWQVRFALFGAAAAAVVAVVFGVVRTPAPVDSVLSAPDAAAIQGAGEGHTTLVVSRSRHQAVLLASDLPALDAGHVYQVWLIGGGHARSAGLMTTEVSQRMLVADLPADVDRIGITVEPAGGSAGPTTPAVTRISLA
ncbi:MULTISPECIES: anti-sigma factor [unclassified Amycolatopsis]|uniref:anti-sigma factor n=1 Tax=unclassified Amycolatopsis TaxID=2618356 RepID=UPI002875C503|nr:MULTISPECIES: anti-sigma factor [unclassified Amycolatopsis]MDS0132173.1 anti-sigma factor [Amycolatopsis sp. 505]MDS0141089.1 anti-sigma factor [Amycolatopsis sp. CM201R]